MTLHTPAHEKQLEDSAWPTDIENLKRGCFLMTLGPLNGDADLRAGDAAL